jgi:hypothetical protein
MQRLSALDLTLLTRASSLEPWTVSLSSLDGGRAASLAGGAWLEDTGDAAMTSLGVGGEELGVRARSLGVGRETDSGAGVRALVSLSVDDAVRLPRDLQARADRHHAARHRRLRVRQLLHRRAASRRRCAASPTPPSGSAAATTARRCAASSATTRSASCRSRSSACASASPRTRRRSSGSRTGTA